MLELQFTVAHSIGGVVGWGYGVNSSAPDNITEHTVNGRLMTASWDHGPVTAAEETLQNETLVAGDFTAWAEIHGGDPDKTTRREVKDRMSEAFTAGEGTIDINVLQLLAKRLYAAFTTISEKINENCAITGVTPLEAMDSLEEEIAALKAMADVDVDI